MKQQHISSRHSKQKGFVAPGSQREKLSSRVLDEAGKSLEYTLTAVRSNIDGLTATEAANRMIEFGPNEVTHDKPPPCANPADAGIQKPVCDGIDSAWAGQLCDGRADG